MTDSTLSPLPAWQALLDEASNALSTSLDETRGIKMAVGDLAIVSVTGDEAEAFLHAQFSADCRALQVGETILTAWCSPKGRVLYLLRVLRQDDGFVVLLPAAQAQAFTKRLGMFVLRAAVHINDLSATQGLIRLLRGELPALPDAVSAARDGDNLWLLGPQAELVALWPSLDASPAGAKTFNLNDIRSGTPRLSVELSDQFLPQELNLDLSGGVSFNKGCYPGQEIIARVKFRGSVKRRLARLSGSGADLLASGARLHDDSGKLIGTVLSAEHNDNGTTELLAVLDESITRVKLGESEWVTQRFDA